MNENQGGKKGTFGRARGSVGAWPMLGGLLDTEKSLVETSQNWIFTGGTWSPCSNHMDAFMKLEDVKNTEDAFIKAGYQKQIQMKRGTWKLVEGTFTLWVNAYNDSLPVYAITVWGELGTIGTVYISSFPDLLLVLEQFRGMLSLFEGIATKQAKVE